MQRGEDVWEVRGDTMIRGIKVKHVGNFNKTEKFLYEMRKQKYFKVLDGVAQEGVEALRYATPVDTGETANSWRYELEYDEHTYRIVYHNDNVQGRANIAILLQYGHATGGGGYVQGIDYINPALRPVFQHIADAAWKVVTSS